MEDRHVSLSDDEVRERFSAFHDGELSPDEAKVVRGRLAESPQLAAEFEAFERVMGGLASLASHGSHDGPAPTPRTQSLPPDPKSAAESSAKSGKEPGDAKREPAATPPSEQSGRHSVLPEDEAVDLLPDLQKTIHKRSGGKFYKTRASRVIGTRPIEVVAAVTLVLLVLVYVMMSYVSGLRPAEAPPSGAVQTGR